MMSDVEDRIRAPYKPEEPKLVFALVDQFMCTARQSGATEEEVIAALRATEAIVPLMQLQSRHFQTIKT